MSSVGVGKRHSCALRTDGSVACWGSNDENQLSANVGALSLTPVEIALSGPALQLSVGMHHSCAVLADHSVGCWGDNGASELGDGTTTQRTGVVTALPAGSATAVAAGAQHTCALAADGTVWCWGGTLGPPSPTKVSGVTGGVQLISGHRFACTRDAAGAVTCWGGNTSGQLGRGNTDNNVVDGPGPVSGITDAIDLAGGSRSACAQRAGGSFVCWGNNDSGELGLGNFIPDFPSPIALSLPGAVQIAAGTRRMCARLDTGAVECWGSNTHGSLGLGDFFTRPGPSGPVIGISGAVDIVASSRHACARLADSSVLCWGDNAYGQLGTGTRAASAAPVDAMIPTGATAVSSLVERTCAVYPSGDVYCWGNVNLGDGNDGWAGLPVKATLTASAVAAGDGHSCAIDGTGAVVCWGYNSHGELGDGTTNNHYTAQVATLGSPATRVAAGFAHACAIVAGKAWCWGNNGDAEIGDGTTTDRPTPVQPSGQGATTATAIGGGFAFTCMVLSTGTVECWGANPFGQLGDNTTTAHSTPAAVSGLANTTALAVGWYHACAIDAGAVKCWGDNANGELGDGSYVNRTAPVTVTLPAAPMVVSAGAYHTCAVLADNTVWCWGANDLAELGSTVADSPTPIQVPGLLATTLTASSTHTCAITTGGVTKCWGGNEEGGLGDGAALAETMAQRAAIICP